MDRRALIRLRLAFLLLGAALLVPLGWLLRSVDARLEAQRRLRHELVAERIFDEMERELTGLLQRENARPSSAYDDDTGTRVENWAPFVVGYFKRDAQSTQLVAKRQLEAARVQRLEEALNISKPALHPSSAETSKRAPTAAPMGMHTDGQGAAAPAFELAPTKQVDAQPVERPSTSAPAPASAFESRAASKGQEDKRAKSESGAARLSTKAGPEDVLKALNRAQEEREQTRQRALPAKRKARAAETSEDDPLSGF